MGYIAVGNLEPQLQPLPDPSLIACFFDIVELYNPEGRIASRSQIDCSFYSTLEPE